MGKIRGDIVALAILLIGLFWLRLALASSIPALTYDGYLVVREAEHIQQTGLPLREDPLSVTGEVRVGNFMYSYVLATVGLLGSGVYKILPNLLMVLLLIPIYLLTRSLSGSKISACIAVILAGTSPVVFSSYLANPDAMPLALLVLLALLYFLQTPQDALLPIVGLSVVLTFLSPLIFVFVLGLLMTIMILRLERIGVDRRINEIFFFTLFLASWFYVVIFKRALLAEGMRVLWHNLPAKYAALQFAPLSVLDVLYGLGTITFLFGILGAYHALFEARERVAFSIVGTILAVVLLLAVRFIEISLGFLLLSLLLAILAGHGLRVMAQYLARTKLPKSIYPIGAVIFLLFILTAALPALTNANAALVNGPNEAEIAELSLLRSQLPSGVVLLTTVREAAAVQYYSGLRTYTDDDFLLLRNGDEIVRDIDTTYTARFGVTIVDKAVKLGFSHILFSRDAQRQYERDRLLIDDTYCVLQEPVGETITIYRVLCRGRQR